MKSQLIRYFNDGKDYREYPDVCFSVCGDLRRVKYLTGMKEGSGKPRTDPGESVREE